jgi:hypothetical protein
MLGLGTTEIVLIVLAGGIFFFGLPKVKEWVEAFKSHKEQAKEVLKG